jgi:TonB-dependent receptor
VSRDSHLKLLGLHDAPLLSRPRNHIEPGHNAMRLKQTAVAAASSLALLPASTLFAGDLTGRVTDSSSGRALPNATVRIEPLGRTVLADRSGEFRVADLPAGSYQLVVTSVGFRDATQTLDVPATGAVAHTFALLGTGVEEITVTGFRLSLATALQDKKSSAVIKDSITADDAGKLPDQNAAEALRRLPGVSTTTDQGEGRYVTVRGIDPGLNNVTLDNQVLGTPEPNDRRIALDTVPANLLAKLEVVKSVTPDMDGNAIGGSINIVTPSAFDEEDGHFASASIDYGYYDLNGENPFGGALAWGQTFGDDRWGIVLSGSYSEREYASHNLQGGDPWQEEGDFFVPDEMVLRDYVIERKRSGVVANLEFRPSDATKLYFRNLYNRFEDIELQPETIYDYRNGDLVDQTATSGTFTEGEGSRELQSRREIQSIQSSTLGGDIELGDHWTLGASYTLGKSEQDTPWDFGWAFELDDALPMSYDTSNTFFDVTAGPEFQDAARFEFDEHFRARQMVEEDLDIVQVDLKRDLAFGDRNAFVKFGAKLLDREKTSDQRATVYDGFDSDDDLLLAQVTRAGDPNFYCDERCYTFGPKIDFDAAQRFFRDNEAAFEVNVEDSIAEEYGVDYVIDEKISAGYVMLQFELTPGMTVTGGVRMEKTEADYQGYDLEFVDGEIDPVPPQVRGSKDYTNWLPGVQMRWAPNRDLVVRAAWTNTIGRAAYEQLVPFRNFEIEEVDPADCPNAPEPCFEGSLEAGNSDLEPIESMNWDASLEWYLSSGVVAAGVFFKDIENPVFTRFQVLEGQEFEGRFYEELEVLRPENAESGDIFGVELNYQQSFTGLPAPFDGLGVSIGYTYSDSSADVLGRDDEIPFFLQSEHIGNLALFYERAGVGLRLGYSYRSEYLDTLGEGPDEDLYVDDHGQLDVKASYDFADAFTVYLQVQNLNDEPLRYTSGRGRRLAENEFYSWSAMAGVQVKF